MKWKLVICALESGLRCCKILESFGFEACYISAERANEDLPGWKAISTLVERELYRECVERLGKTVPYFKEIRIVTADLTYQGLSCKHMGSVEVEEDGKEVKVMTAHAGLSSRTPETIELAGHVL
ncbi:hypothetical protein HJFPF1_00139 [Paramyrothecium foliicola]|nr:hypothetical protein HJFPF1_00139 [Paramyrothecium foliicola]